MYRKQELATARTKTAELAERVDAGEITTEGLFTVSTFANLTIFTEPGRMCRN